MMYFFLVAMDIRYTVFGVKFSVPTKFLIKGFFSIFNTMHSMPELGKVAKS